MGRRILLTGTVMCVLALAATALAADVSVEVEVCRILSAAESHYKGTFLVAVEGDGVTKVELKHPHTVHPFTLADHITCFRVIKFEGKKDWGVIAHNLPNGRFEIIVHKGLIVITHPFTIEHALMPPQAVIVSPRHGETVKLPYVIIEWGGVLPGVDSIELEIVCDGSSQIKVELPADETSFQVPQGILRPGFTYELHLVFIKFGKGIRYCTEHKIEFFVAAP